MSLTTESAVGHDELAVLKLLALEGGLSGDVKISCSALSDRLGASNQTASRRLQRLESGGLLERETVSDGQWVEITDGGEGMLRAEYEDYRRVFETGAEIELEGTITGGMGEGRHYISLPGYKRQFEERLGYDPFPGTLNVDLREDSVRRRSAMSSLEPVPIDGWEDDDRTYGPAVCYPATVETADGETYENAHTIAPERTHHDDDQLEVIAPDTLREELGLEDDDHVTVYVGDR
ncbi:CTP-dependent riboflavin kinase [Halostagnicola sp. A-GB9-2]|uniref:CTP-dependent riboflavin kinase n=1 Tax=Halostagnicola sp. A-GB9-2 TaxID=3048066 RepID=UPI0024BFE1CD|nr:CTP-dependent riboflavin kinase [Halostagnicola sp. A-GB9-2]MDJ1430950.1 CTP-dependent riboflavin kinase [Halostagnicola sp. A-GB9-2]